VGRQAPPLQGHLAPPPIAPGRRAVARRERLSSSSSTAA
jgi:hypothetical protein